MRGDVRMSKTGHQSCPDSFMSGHLVALPSVECFKKTLHRLCCQQSSCSRG